MKRKDDRKIIKSVKFSLKISNVDISIYSKIIGMQICMYEMVLLLMVDVYAKQMLSFY